MLKTLKVPKDYNYKEAVKTIPPETTDTLQVIFAPSTESTGEYLDKPHVIVLDPESLTTDEQKIDTLLFELQNARQPKKLSGVKKSTLSPEKKAEKQCEIEYDSDRLYVKALLEMHELEDDDYQGLAEKLISKRILATEKKATYKDPSKEKESIVELPDKKVLPGQAKRQALWWWKTSHWSEKERRRVWTYSPHVPGELSTYETYRRQFSKK